MAEAELVNDAIDAGRELVVAADQDQVPLRAAFWLLDGATKRWSLVLEEEPSAKLTLKDFAAALLSAIAKIADPRRRDAATDLMLGSVALATQPHPIAELLRGPLGTAKSVMRARLGGTRVGDAVVEGALLYRLEKAQAMT